MNNTITYLAPKIKTVAHSMSLNNRISCVVGISIFGFNLMELNMIPNFKQFLQVKTVNTDKKSYYQWYDVKIIRALHKQAIMKHKIYENILARQSGMYYIPGIRFQTSLFDMDKSKALTKSNQLEKSNHKKQIRCRCGSINHLQITSKYFPVGISCQKGKKLALEVGLSQVNTNKLV